MENEKKSHLYALIRNYTFINFQQKVPPIRLFPPILLLLLPNYITFLKFTMAHFDLRRPQKPLRDHNWENYLTIDQFLIGTPRRLSYTFINLYQMLPKNPTYTFIQTYTFINFQQKFPPIRLIPPILLLIFEEISHLYFYSDSSSIRNSRVSCL